MCKLCAAELDGNFLLINLVSLRRTGRLAILWGDMSWDTN